MDPYLLFHWRNTWLVAHLRKEKELAKKKAKYLRQKAAFAINLGEASDSESGIADSDS